MFNEEGVAWASLRAGGKTVDSAASIHVNGAAGAVLDASIDAGALTSFQKGGTSAPLSAPVKNWTDKDGVFESLGFTWDCECVD